MWSITEQGTPYRLQFFVWRYCFTPTFASLLPFILMPEIQQAVEQQTEQRDNGGGRPWFIGCFSRTSADRDARMYGIYIYIRV